jgi:hypothetical protein
MKAMVKPRVVGNRLSLGSWSIPFARSRNDSLEEKRQSRRYSSMAAPVVKEADIETPSPLIPKSATSTSKLIELAQTIAKETEKLDQYIKDCGLPQPSFEVDAPLNFPKLPEEVKKSREEVVRATKELGDLVAGPTDSVRWMAWDVRLPFSHLFELELISHSTTTPFPSTQSTTTNSPNSFPWTHPPPLPPSPPSPVFPS